MSEKIKCSICSKLFQDAEMLSMHRKAQHGRMEDRSQLLDLAEQRLYEFLQSDGADKNLREVATKAVIVYSAEAKREASRNNALTAALVMARAVTGDKSEIQRIVKTALPDHPVSKALK